MARFLLTLILRSVAIIIRFEFVRDIENLVALLLNFWFFATLLGEILRFCDLSFICLHLFGEILQDTWSFLRLNHLSKVRSKLSMATAHIEKIYPGWASYRSLRRLWRTFAPLGTLSFWLRLSWKDAGHNWIWRVRLRSLFLLYLLEDLGPHILL